MNIAGAVALMMGTAIINGCNDAPRGGAVQLAKLGKTREQQLATRLAGVDKGEDKSKPVAMWLMPPELREISGMALMADGRLLAHDDEASKIYVIDPRKGILLKSFTLGTGMRGDFEAIAVAGTDIYMLASKGTLFQFQEGANGVGVPYTTIDLRTGKECEFESMVYEADSNWLVMPCKAAGKKAPEDQLIVYRWKLDAPDSERLSTVSTPFASLVGDHKWKALHPSDMTIDPTTGHYVMVASHEEALVETTRDWKLIRAEKLPHGHNQPEGIVITKDRVMMISDEATRKPAAITLYRWYPSQQAATIQATDSVQRPDSVQQPDSTR
ncbi:MAG TPA: hypothetical protein VM053_02745 [Gemmatimonadaceae bacterium]|nr:hypothetical protein [Gemmatimonadaceae bacterium]